MKLQRVCVFCGAKAGADVMYMEAAEKLGNELARRKVNLVYGGASIGLMGKVAEICLSQGLEVDGVIPRWVSTANK